MVKEEGKEKKKKRYVAGLILSINKTNIIRTNICHVDKKKYTKIEEPRG